MRGPSSINVVSVLTYLIVIGGFYGLWKYGPEYWKREEVKNMIQNVLVNANKSSDGQMHGVVLGRMRNEFRIIDMPEENVEVYRDGTNTWVYCNVYYPVDIEHLFGRTQTFWMTIKEKRRILNL